MVFYFIFNTLESVQKQCVPGTRSESKRDVSRKQAFSPVPAPILSAFVVLTELLTLDEDRVPFREPKNKAAVVAVD